MPSPLTFAAVDFPKVNPRVADQTGENAQENFSREQRYPRQLTTEAGAKFFNQEEVIRATAKSARFVEGTQEQPLPGNCGFDAKVSVFFSHAAAKFGARMTNSSSGVHSPSARKIGPAGRDGWSRRRWHDRRSGRRDLAGLEHLQAHGQ
jgi:hypothetical protein